MPKELYFIAIIPPKYLADKIHLLKEEISEKYESYHSLKVPEHITIIPPFRCDEEELEKVITALEDIAATIIPFEVQLNSFGYFGHKVIFIDAFSDPENALPGLYQSAKNLFQQQLPFINIKLDDEYHSHLTIANRDLRQSAFRKAWQEFKERKFEETFIANSFFVLNHPNNIWKPFREFNFANQ